MLMEKVVLPKLGMNCQIFESLISTHVKHLRSLTSFVKQKIIRFAKKVNSILMCSFCREMISCTYVYS